ncbi:hypothetical protein [Demequina litorisediminis]|nr:hypothetical protein [Demequina litorisediminis]
MNARTVPHGAHGTTPRPPVVMPEEPDERLPVPGARPPRAREAPGTGGRQRQDNPNPRKKPKGTKRSSLTTRGRKGKPRPKKKG